MWEMILGYLRWAQCNRSVFVQKRQEGQSLMFHCWL